MKNKNERKYQAKEWKAKAVVSAFLGFALLSAASSSLATTPPQFANLSSCQLSTDPNTLTGTCTDIEAPNAPLPALYDGTAGTRYAGAFGAQYFRVSLAAGAVAENPLVTQMYPDYAKVPAWNADGSRFFLYDNKGFIQLFDGATYSWIESLSNQKGFQYDGQDAEPRWSHSDPNTIYYVSGMKFNAYNIATHTTTVIRTFTNADFGGVQLTNIHNGDEGNSDDADRYWAFYAQDGSYTQQAILVYDLQNNAVLAHKGYGAGGICGASACPTTANWVGISHAGNYVLVNWNKDASDSVFGVRGAGQEVFDRDLNYVSQPSEKNWHCDVSQLADGTEVFVGAADLGGANGYKASRVVRLSDGATVRSCMFPDGVQGWHVSGRTNGNLLKGWVLYSTYNQSQTGIVPAVFSMENFALNLDTCEVRRIVHTQSVFSGSNYFSEPHASMNWDFTKIVWGSNWRDQNGDVQTYISDLSGTAPGPSNGSGTTDTIAPSVSVTAPASGQTVSGIVAVTASATDNVGVTKVEYFGNGQYLFASTVAPYSYRMDTTTLSNGSYTLIAKAYDAAGNVGQSTVSLTVANSSSGTGGGSSAVNVAAQSNGGVATASSTVNSNYPVSAVIDGDRKGLNWGAGGGWNDATPNSYPDWVQITFNGQKSISEVDVFTLQDSYANPLEPFAGQTFAAYGITAFDVQYWNGTAWTTVPGGSVTGNNLVWRKVSFSPLTTDRIRVQVNAALADYSRITEIEAWGVASVADTTAPVVNSFSLPSSATTLTVPVITLAAQDNVAVTGYLITESPSTPTPLESGWSASAPVSFTFADSGARTAYAWAKDAAGNVSAALAFNVTITLPDTSAPVVSMTSPSSGASVTGITTVAVAASDNVAVTRAELYVNGSLQGTTSSAPWSFSWNSATLANGPCTLTVKAYDAAGNLGLTSETVNVFNDSSAPTVAIASPAAGSTVSGNVNVTVNANDNVGVTRVVFSVKGTTITDTAAPYTFSWNSATVANGSYTLTVTAYDAAGNARTATTTVNVANASRGNKK